MKTTRHIIFLFLLVSSVVAYSYDKPLLLNNLTIQNGLSSGSVTCVLQDSDGFIWIGTEDGLNKFDGYQIQNYRHNVLENNSIGGNSIRTLFEDSRKNLWIGLKGAGLSRLNLKTGKITTYRNTNDPNSLIYNDVAGLVEDKEGNLWIAVDRGGLDMFDYEQENFKHYNVQARTNSDLLNNAFTDILLDKDGQLWLSSWGGGVFRFDLGTKKFMIPDFWQHEKVDENACRHIFSLYNDNDNNIWVSSAHGGLYKIDKSRKVYKQFTPCKDGSNCITTRSVRAVCDDERGMLWIAVDGGGINVFDKKSEKVVRIIRRKEHGKSLLSNSVFNIYRDKMNMMWLGTSMGLNYFNPNSVHFDLYVKSANGDLSLSENQVMSILKDRQGNVWVGGTNSLDRIDAARTGIKRYQTDNLMYRDAFRHNQALCEDVEGNIWIGAYSEYLLKYSPDIDKFVKIEIPSNNGHMLPYRNVYSIYEDTDGTLWLATELGTLNYNPQKEVFTPLFFSKGIIYPEEKSHVVYRDKDMDFWVGTEGGLRRYTKDLKSYIVYKVENDVSNGLTNNFITALLEDSHNNFWVGTYGGLHRFDKATGKFELMIRDDKRFDDPVLGLCEDKSGNLWLSTITKIVKFNPKTNTFYLYDESDGLQDKDFYLGACFQAVDGELFFGGKNGFNSFYPEALKINTIHPKVLITDLLIFNKSIEPSEKGILTRPISETRSIRLKHSEAVVTFRFVALNYISPQKNKYAYMLEGFDKEWIMVDASQRSATYTNLPAGEYVFKVKASNNDGMWNEREAQISLKVLPPFWKSWIAYLLYFGFVLFVIFLIIRYFTVRERDRIELEIAKIEARRSKEIEQMKVNVFTNVSHEFRTPLSLILTPLNQIIQRKAYPSEDEAIYKLMYRNTQRLLRLINQLLDFRKIEEKKLELTFQYDDVLKHIKDTAMSFQFLASDKKIQYTIQSDQTEIWTKFDADKMDKILYNLISNAFNYTPEEGKVVITVSKIESDKTAPKLHIEVADTGVGITDADMQRLFTLFFQGDTQKSVYSGGSGIGLALTKQLVELHNGEISVQSKLNEGTTFTVILPITGNNEMSVETSVKDWFDTETKADESPLPIEERRSMDVLLVVEDSYDMRMYIRNTLVEQFKIILAKDGKEGLDKAIEHIPDLIISDIMMPSMDGIAMTKTLRNDERTSHIPIILLTSLQSEAQVIEGYQLGVEDYITKPFSVAILRARIQNILHSRKKVWEKYRQSSDIEEYREKMAEDPKKQAFVSKINEVILMHIAETDFSVDVLANNLNMSVNQLSRKVKALMNTTPYNVIVQVRMTHAAKLLKESDKNISEVAFAVGYHELSNFSRAFKNYFHKSPREYMRG